MASVEKQVEQLSPEARSADQDRRRLAEWEEAQLTPLLLVEIETAAPCNRRCRYCPVSTHPAREGRMSDELFGKIIDDLRAMGFRGTLSLHFYNEPLLDLRLESFIRLAREALPEVYLLLYTNGDALTAERAETLFAARLSHIRVSVHDEVAEERLGRLLDALETRLAQRISLVRYYDQSLPLDNRCGTIRLADGVCLPDRSAGCHNITSMVIDWQGRVPLCCNDFLVANPHGDVNQASLRDIWERSRPLRKQIFLGHYDLPACRICTGQL